MLEELGYYISRGLLENGKALANLANLVLPAVLTACDLADVLYMWRIEQYCIFYFLFPPGIFILGDLAMVACYSNADINNSFIYLFTSIIAK